MPKIRIEDAVSLNPGERIEPAKMGARLIRDANGVRVGYCEGLLTVRVGDEVVSNGRLFAPKGTKGRVVAILDDEFRSCDVIGVQFEGDKSCYSAKFKDFEIEF